jgi:hypothetical protein
MQSRVFRDAESRLGGNEEGEEFQVLGLRG